MPRRLYALLAIVTFATATVLLWVSLSPIRYGSSPQLAAAEQRIRNEHRDRVAEYTEVVARIRQRTSDPAAALSSSEVQTLENILTFGRTALENDDIEQSSAQRAKAHSLVVAAAGLVADFPVADQHSLQAVKLSELAANSLPDVRNSLTAARAQNARCCVLAESGRVEDALSHAWAAFNWASRAVEIDPGFHASYWDLVLAQRSLAIVAAIQPEPDWDTALNAARDCTVTSLSLHDALQEDRGFYEWNLPRFVIDAHQIQAMMERQSGELDASRATVRKAITQLDRLERELDQIATRDQISIRVLPLRRVRYCLERQLHQEDRFAAAPKQDEVAASVGATAFGIAEPLMLVESREGRTLHPNLMFRGKLLPEFVPQEAIGLIWPDDNWGRPATVSMVRELVHTVHVLILVEDESLREDAARAFEDAAIPQESVTFLNVSTDTRWLRDFGPLTLIGDDGHAVLSDFEYTSAPSHLRLLDERTPSLLSHLLNMSLMREKIYLQGGEMLANGAGLCVVSQTALDVNQIVGLTPQFVTSTLKRLTGANQILALEPLEGEATGHLDWFLTFTAPDCVVVGEYFDPNDPNTRLLNDHARRLAEVVTPVGPLRVVRVPMPPRGSEWFGGTYTNVVFANGTLLVPSWKLASTEMEHEVVATYQKLLPDWNVVLIESDVLGIHEGSLHCATLNFPLLPKRVPRREAIQSSMRPDPPTRWHRL